MVKSFFDPAWMGLGVLGVYGRWAGVNWVWTVMLTLYHTVVSIAIPIMLVELMYPGERDEPWLGRRGLHTVSILLAIDVLFGFTLLTPYRPPLVPYLASGLAVLALYRLARRLPPSWADQRLDVPWGTFRLSLAGFLAIAALFFGGWALPALHLPASLTILFMLLAAFGFWRLIRWASGEGAWDDRGRWALVSGSLTVFILLALAAENDPARVDNPAGMGLVGLTAAVALLYLGVRIRKRTRDLRAPVGGTG